MNVDLSPDNVKPIGVNLNTPAAAEAALRTFWRLAEAWKLTTAEQIALLGVARTTLYQWRQGKLGPLDRHILERLSYLFGIYGALQILLPVPERANEWIRKPNTAPFLAGSSALDRMLGGQVTTTNGPHADPPAEVNLNTVESAHAAIRTFRRLAEAWKPETGEQIALRGAAYTMRCDWKQGRVGPLVFKPKALNNARATGHIGLHWDGARISHWFEKGTPRAV